MPLRFIHIQHHPCLGGKGRVDMLKAIRYVCWKKTIALYDYDFRSFIKGTGVSDIKGLDELRPSQVQSMLVFLSERLCLNSRGTVFPIMRQILSYLYAAGFIPTDFSGMVLTPAYKNTHSRPYITASDEEKAFSRNGGSSASYKSNDAVGTPARIAGH